MTLPEQLQPKPIPWKVLAAHPWQQMRHPLHLLDPVTVEVLREIFDSHPSSLIIIIITITVIKISRLRHPLIDQKTAPRTWIDPVPALRPIVPNPPRNAAWQNDVAVGPPFCCA